MKKLLIAFVLLAITSAFSQETKPESKLALKMNMPQLVDIFNFPVISIGAEMKVNNYLGICPEPGYQLYDFKSTQDTIFLKPRGFKVSVEGRVYILKLFRPDYQKKAKGWFCGLQAFYRQNQCTSLISYYNKVDEEGVEKVSYHSSGISIPAKLQAAHSISPLASALDTDYKL